MKKVIIAMFASVLLMELAIPQTQVDPPPPSCSVDPPSLPKIVQIDPKPAKYAGPACLAGETCTTPDNWFEEAGYKLTDQGAEITYTDQGQLYTHECPAGSVNSYWFEEDQWVKHDAPTCWKREPVAISSCK